MSEKPENPPAFPLQSSFVKEHGYFDCEGKEHLGTVRHIPGHTGMTLRDYYAGQVLQGEMAAQDDSPIGYVSNEAQADIVAKKCYLMAEAMLKARQS